MGGHRQPAVERPIQHGQDPHEIYEAACEEFADAFGYERNGIKYWWSQIALARMACGEPQSIAEFLAMRNVRSIFDCRGRDTD